MQNHPEGFNQSVCRKLFEAESNKDDKFSSKEMSIINTAKVYSAVGTVAFCSGSWFLCRKLLKFTRFPSFLATFCLALPLGFNLVQSCVGANLLNRMYAEKGHYHSQVTSSCRMMHCFPYLVGIAGSMGANEKSSLLKLHLRHGSYEDAPILQK